LGTPVIHTDLGIERREPVPFSTAFPNALMKGLVIPKIEITFPVFHHRFLHKIVVFPEASPKKMFCGGLLHRM
jgi:hypothetical protein